MTLIVGTAAHVFLLRVTVFVGTAVLVFFCVCDRFAPRW